MDSLRGKQAISVALDEARDYARAHPEAERFPSRAMADAVLDSIGAQVERVRNNGARRRLRKALAKATERRARTLEIERLRQAGAVDHTHEFLPGDGL